MNAKPELIKIILFDGVCNLCNSSVNFIIDHDPQYKFRFASLQSEQGQKLLSSFSLEPIFYNSIVLIEGTNYFQKSTAVLRIAKELSGPWPILYYAFILIPAFIRDFCYELIAKNRYRLFGKKDVCRIPTPELRERFL